MMDSSVVVVAVILDDNEIQNENIEKVPMGKIDFNRLLLIKWPAIKKIILTQKQNKKNIPKLLRIFAFENQK